MSPYGERLVRVEEQVDALKSDFHDHKEETKEALEGIRTDLKELLALRNKGAGILWLIGGILSTSLLVLLSEAFHWFSE